MALLISNLIVYTLTVENLASCPYYTEAVKVFKANKAACSLLGEPVRFQALRLGDKDNLVTAQYAQVTCTLSYR